MHQPSIMVSIRLKNYIAQLYEGQTTDKSVISRWYIRIILKRSENIGRKTEKIAYRKVSPKTLS